MKERLISSILGYKLYEIDYGNKLRLEVRNENNEVIPKSEIPRDIVFKLTEPYIFEILTDLDKLEDKYNV